MNTGEIINLFRHADEPETDGCKPCHRCQFELHAKDKFCRRCGSRQFEFVTRNPSRRTITKQLTATRA
ncbi:MAG: hypothetical protein JNK38_15545 [Acidobacteria bacterium]|nr:hypothetical protein [Acidobacteriota bacterium]